MYRIMLVAKEGNSEVNHLYKFFTVTNPEGKAVPYEAETLEMLDTQIEKMINGDYKKKILLPHLLESRKKIFLLFRLRDLILVQIYL